MNPNCPLCGSPSKLLYRTTIGNYAYFKCTFCGHLFCEWLDPATLKEGEV